MATENAPYQVLVPSGNAAILAKGSRPSALAVGQIGFFSLHTGLSLDATSSAAEFADFYIAVGQNVTGAGGGATMEDIKQSAGQMIQQANVRYLTVQPTLDSVAKVVEVTGLKVVCDSAYGVKVEFRGQKIYALNGYNPFVKSFIEPTGCCKSDCPGCAISGMDFIQALVAQINADEDGLVKATAFANTISATVGDTSGDGTLVITVGTTVYNVPVLGAENATQTAARIAAVINSQADSPYRATNAAAVLTIYPTTSIDASFPTIALTSAGGSGVALSSITSVKGADIADLATFETTYPGVTPALRLTAQPAAIAKLGGSTVLNYNSSGDTDIIVTGIGFECGIKVTTVTDMRLGQGRGNTVKYWENYALGWGPGGPYRLSSVLGMERNAFPSSSVNTSANYNIISLGYDIKSVAGWEIEQNNVETIIAVPCADTTTLQGFIAVTDVAFAGKFGALTDDVATYDCTNSALNLSALTPATDGVESLA